MKRRRTDTNVHVLKGYLPPNLATQLSAIYLSTLSTYPRYPDATPEELETANNVCIICREEMLASCKKLPCNHIFHTACLRSWFQRQQTCPTCRMDILSPSVVARLAAAAQANRRGQQGEGGGPPQAPLPGHPPPPMMFPHMMAPPMWPGMAPPPPPHRPPPTQQAQPADQQEGIHVGVNQVEWSYGERSLWFKVVCEARIPTQTPTNKQANKYRCNETHKCWNVDLDS